MNPRRHNRGLALIEIIVVVVLVALIAGLTYPATIRGLESIRLATASDEVAAFLNGALERADRKQTAVEITISKARNLLVMRSAEPGFERVLTMPDGVAIQAVLPEVPLSNEFAAEPGIRTVLIYPGGTAPRIAVQLGNSRGVRRIISIDPVTGVPRIEKHG